MVLDHWTTRNVAANCVIAESDVHAEYNSRVFVSKLLTANCHRLNNDSLVYGSYEFSGLHFGVPPLRYSNNLLLFPLFHLSFRCVIIVI